MKRKKKGYMNFQQRAYDFKVGDAVIPQYDENTSVGRIVALYPAIGMADIQFSYGQGRYPVEDIEKVTESELGASAPNFEDVPGGAGTVSVPGAPPKKASAIRVASQYMKYALYWDQGPRIYRATREEQEGTSYICPKCKDTPMLLKKYKFEGKLLVCPECNFMIKRENIKGSGWEKAEPPSITESGSVSGLVMGGKK